MTVLCIFVYQGIAFINMARSPILSVNVAGKSQILDPAGADILGVNIPFGEFLNSGAFDTTYLDNALRVSRSRVGVVEQLRVFVRSGPLMEDPIVEEKPPMQSDENIESPSDVEEAEPVSEGIIELSSDDRDEGDESVEAPSDVETDD